MKPSDDLIVSSAEPTGANRRKVWIQKGNNLFNSEIIVSALSSTGEVTSSTTRLSTDRYIEVKSSTNYTLSVSEYNEAKGSPKVNIVYYDDSKNFISTSSWWNNYYTFTTQNTCKYIKITFYLSNSTTQTLTTSDVSKVQLEQGSTATSYEAYIEPEIYVRNDNNVYEKLVKQEKILHTAVFEREFNNVSTQTNVEFNEMFPGLNLNDIICFNVEITNTYSTWDRIYAHVLRSTGTLQVRSYAETQDLLAVRVTAFYK